MAMKVASMTPPALAQGPSRDKVGEMFDRISPRYDLLNRLLSLRRDVAWRRRLGRSLPKGAKLHLLDLACGTADVLLTLKTRCDRVDTGIGLDLARGMLTLGREKIRDVGLTGSLSLAEGDASRLPFGDASFDCVTIAFGIRNFADLKTALSEIRRVLRPGGRLLILEFSLPTNAIIRALYLIYFRHILPRLGALISGDAMAYRYLDQTVETFPYGAAMDRILSATGFVDVEHHPQTLGIATIYRADRPASGPSDEGRTG